MYAVLNNNPPVIEAVYRLPLDDELWFDRTRTSVEELWDNIAVSYDPLTGTGIIVVPATFFNVSRIESFFLISYTPNTGFGKTGSIVDITGLQFNRELSAVIQNGYVYTIWGNEIKSALFDATVILTGFEF
jgi:hypothetical protein